MPTRTRALILMFATTFALVAAACQPAPPHVYHYKETGTLTGYNAHVGQMGLSGTMLRSMRLTEPARCFNTAGAEMSCANLRNHIGKRIEITWHGNPETGAHTVTRVQVVK